MNQLRENARYRSLSPDDIAALLDRDDEIFVIDVREREDHAKGAIPGSVNVPRGMLEHSIDQVTTDKDKKIVLYCGGGSRSALAAASLKKMGFKNVISLAGGYRGWKQAE